MQSYPTLDLIVRQAQPKETPDSVKIGFTKPHGPDFCIYLPKSAILAFTNFGLAEMQALFKSLRGHNRFRFEKSQACRIIAALAEFSGLYFVRPVYEDPRFEEQKLRLSRCTN